MTPSDEELAERSKRGSHDAFTVLVDRHQRRMYGLALQLLRHPDDAADAAQEAFLRCYAGLPTYNVDHSFGAWLYRIAYNHCLDVLRRRQRSPVARGAPDAIDQVLQNTPDPGPGVEETAERNMSVEALQGAVDRVPNEARHILVLRYTLDLSYSEIAQILNVPESTVTMRLHHAKKAVRERIHQQKAEPRGPS